ncbi:aminopeptidase N-like [Sabethes cyaneus]|uniref:aminopeptidase N-like n=1 Tax=Sabethes cyaneus TaxID=53552 RepID=UPI00237ED4E8|nr:aminopeptidase N-like [Sabethes cyaneus]
MFTVLLSVIAVYYVTIPSVTAADGYRLPREVIPLHYDLVVLTHLGDDDGEGFRFYGVVNITVIGNYDSNDVTLHAKELTIGEDRITISDLYHKQQMDIFTIGYDPGRDFLTITVTNGLFREGHRYVLSIPFEAELRSDVVGYYRSSYLDSKSQERIWLSVTQFQAIHARQAFPCFDEPELKATFNIALGHHPKYNALSNMPLIRREAQSDWVVDHFARSVSMSTYLVAYSINDYSSVEAPTGASGSTNVSVRSWSRRDAADNLQYANAIAIKLVELYERNFKLKFPLPKLDFIVIPDMLFAAMENWGLVTFTEAGLEYAPSSSTLDDLHFVSSVVAHEIAHMWFGNLVTMRWWTDLWLNEGFARYTEFLAVDQLHPEWRTLDGIVIEDVQEIFKFDALESSHTVSAEIVNPEEIPQLFDSISYKKGSALVRMMHLFLGDEVYRRGVARYLQKYQFKNAAQDDLWRALTEEARQAGSLPEDFDLKAVMDSWTLQTGYPVVYVERNYSSRTATFQQTRFMYDQTVDDPSCWWIPLTVSTSRYSEFNITQPQAWLQCSKDTAVALTNAGTAQDWVIINNKLAGLYKVRYDQNNYRLLAKNLNGPKYHTIDTINRAQLIDDALDFSWAGLQDYSIAFALLNYLPAELEYIPWKAALSNFEILDRVLVNTNNHAHLEAYVTHLLSPAYEKLNIFSETTTTNVGLGRERLIKLIVDRACQLEIQHCVRNSVQLVKRWLREGGPNPTPLSVRSTVYCTAIRKGRRREWNFLWARYREANATSSERLAIARGLACTRDVTLMEQLLRWSVDEQSGLRLEDTTVVFGTIAEQPGGAAVARRFLFENIERMADYVNPETFESRLASHVKVLARQITGKTEQKELEQFVADRKGLLASNSIAVGQALELAHINIQWVRDRYGDFVDTLKQLEKVQYDPAKLGWL